MAHGVTDAEERSAEQDQAEENRQQRHGTERQLRVAMRFLHGVEFAVFLLLAVICLKHLPPLKMKFPRARAALLLLRVQRRGDTELVEQGHQLHRQGEDDGSVLFYANLSEGLKIS